MSFLDMSQGGWDGWRFGKWGKAKVWRLHAPGGDTFTPGELLLIRENERNVCALESQVKRLRSMQLPLTYDNFLTVESAYFILQGLLTVFSPEVTNTVFERRTPPRAFNLRLHNKTVPSQTP